MFIRDEWLSQYFPENGAYCYSDPSELIDLPKGFIYAKLNPANVVGCNKLEDLGFRLTEVLLTFKQVKALDSGLSDVNECRFAIELDKQQVIEIAKNAFTYSRFYKDPNIGNHIASKIKEDWVYNYFLGKRGTHMIVFDKNNHICGFMLLINNIIDLIATSSNYMRCGVASKMIAFANKKFGLLTAGTQGSNESSINLYTKSGFVLKQTQLVLHKH